MRRIKLFENFNPDELLMRVNYQSESDRYQSPQLNTTDNSVNGEFITYLWNIADIKRIDALGGTESKSNLRRYNISDLVQFEDVIVMAPTGLSAGIKVTKYPFTKIMDYDRWPGGYIQGFIRMDSNDPRFGEYFIWTYIKMDKLRDILEKFGDKLKLF